MKFQALPPDMQDDIRKLAKEHHISLYEAMELYFMGGNHHADILCKPKSMNTFDGFIRIKNNKLWDEYNKKMYRELNKSPLQREWEKLVDIIAKELRIYQLLDWLNNKLGK